MGALWNKDTALYWLLAYIGLLVFGVFFSPFNLFPTPDEKYLIQQGERLNGAFETPQALTQQGWEIITLKDDWRNLPNVETDAWYRFNITPKQFHSESLAVYLPTVRQNAAVYLNNHWIGQGGRFEPPIAQLWNHPLLFEFSSTLFKAGNNTLHIRLSTNLPASGYLGPLYLGPRSALLPAWEWRHFIKVELLAIISIFLLIMAGINFVLWALRRQDTYYLWFGLVTFVWGLRSYLLLVPELPLSDGLRAALRLIFLGYGVAFVVVFNQRFFGYRNKFSDWVLLIYCLPLALPLLFMNLEKVHTYGHKVWAYFCVVLATYISVHIYYFYRRDGHKSALMMLYAGSPLLITGLRDLMVLNGHWDPQNGFLINYASPLTLFLVMWFILQRFVKSLSEAEELNVTLDQRVKQKEHEIRLHFTQQEKLHQQQLLNEERERIMRDMHDGLGGHLVGLKSLAEHQPPNLNNIKTQVDRALVDLRLVINSLDVTSQSLSTLLGAMRSRWQRLSDATQITLKWEVVSSRESAKLGPARTLQIMRILEEAYSNCLQHSGADTITVSSGLNQQQMWITIRDNGKGNTGNKNAGDYNGRGIANMHHRALQIGAEISVDHTNKGASVKLLLPC